MQSIRFRYFRQIRKAVPEQAVKAYLTKVLNEKEAEVKTTRESIEKMKKSLSEYRAMTPEAYVKMKDEQAKAEAERRRAERTKSREKKEEKAKAEAEKKSAEKPEAKAPADVTAAADAAKESAKGKGKGGKKNVSKAAEPATVTPAKKAADALETMLRKQA